MAEQDINKFETKQIEYTEVPVDPAEASPSEHESTPTPSEPTEISDEDPTLRVMASEYAIWGLSRNTGHAYTGHVWGD